MTASPRTKVTPEPRPVSCRGLESDPRTAINAWIQRPGAPGYRFLLATSLDGVTWGLVDEAERGAPVLRTSDAVLRELSPALSNTLTECRLFTDDQGRGGGAELHAWRSPLGWQATETIEGPSAGLAAAIDETQILFGTSVEDVQGGFTIVREGQGLKHAVPIAVEKDKCNGTYRPLRLHVRHYLSAGDNGAWRVEGSRLAGLSVNWSDKR